MLPFAYKRFDGAVPEPGALDAEDKALLVEVEAGFETVGERYNACKFWAGRGAGPRGPWLPGWQGALVPDQGGPPGRGDERVHHPARRGQPEDDPGADPSPHGQSAP